MMRYPQFICLLIVIMALGLGLGLLIPQSQENAGTRTAQPSAEEIAAKEPHISGDTVPESIPEQDLESKVADRKQGDPVTAMLGRPIDSRIDLRTSSHELRLPKAWPKAGTLTWLVLQNHAGETGERRIDATFTVTRASTRSVSLSELRIDGTALATETVDMRYIDGHLKTFGIEGTRLSATAQRDLQEIGRQMLNLYSYVQGIERIDGSDHILAGSSMKTAAPSPTHALLVEADLCTAKGTYPKENGQLSEIGLHLGQAGELTRCTRTLAVRTSTGSSLSRLQLDY